MMWVFAIVVVVVMGVVAAVAAGKGDPMAPTYDDRLDAFVPADRPLVGEDIRRTRFSLALRGYRMSEVDELLARLAAQLDETGETDGAVSDRPGEDPGDLDASQEP